MIKSFGMSEKIGLRTIINSSSTNSSGQSVTDEVDVEVKRLIQVRIIINMFIKKKKRGFFLLNFICYFFFLTGIIRTSKKHIEKTCQRTQIVSGSSCQIQNIESRRRTSDIGRKSVGKSIHFRC